MDWHRCAIGLYETELVHRRATGWDGREELELATARWVASFNRNRLRRFESSNPSQSTDRLD